MARKGIEYVATIAYLERLNNSVNGNPRFRIHFEGGDSAITQSDASISYGLGNRENMGVPVLVQATQAGRVWNVTPLHRGSCDEMRDKATCLSCHLEWCARHDPAPSALCPRCHGRGYTTAPW